MARGGGGVAGVQEQGQGRRRDGKDEGADDEFRSWAF
jgi:hypothetical protein